MCRRAIAQGAWPRSKVAVSNTGKRDGDEVVQAYLCAPSAAPAGVRFAVRSLVAFDRVHLAVGETKTVALHVPMRPLQYWSVAEGNWVTAGGKRMVSVGASARELRVAQAIR